MTTDIKAAIAGAIEAMETYAAGIGFSEIEDNGAIARNALAALRRIEFADENSFTVTAEQYARLCEMLDAPPKDLPRLRKLLSNPAIADDHDILLAINDLAQCCELPDMDVHAVVVKHKDVINRAYAYWNKLTYDANQFGEGI
jgi:hypothetical protein